MASEYPKRSQFFAHKFVRLLQKSCAAMDIGQSSCLFLCYIAHTEDAARYSGPVRFWNEQLMTVMGFKSPKQLNEARSRAVDSGWLVYDRSGNREVGRYWVTIPSQFEGLDDALIEDNHSVNHSEYGTNSGTNSGMNKVGIAERIGDELRNEKVTESGKPSIPIPFPIPSYSPGVEIQVPESMNTPEIIATVGKWFRHLESKDKPEKVPMPNSPQEESFWLQIAKMGPERFLAAATMSMAEGWVTLREPRTNSVDHSTSENRVAWIEAQKAVKAYPDDWQKRKEILGDVVFEALKRTGSRAVLDANSFELKNLQALFDSHLSDIRKATNGTAKSN